MKLNELIKKLVLALDETNESNDNSFIKGEVIFFSKYPSKLEKSDCKYTYNNFYFINRTENNICHRNH